MMSESQDVAVDLSGHLGEKAGPDARPPATSEIPLDEDSGDESVEELDLSKQDKPSAPMWSFEYYQGFFDVDTDQVISRVISSFIPRHNFVRLVRPNPDLYGPFWICITLALSFTITGNLTGYLQAKGEDYHWTYNFRHLTFAATAIYGYVWILPAILWVWLWWRGMKVYTLLEITCVYGYSLAIFLPCSLVWVVPSTAVRWTVVMVGMVLSGSVLFRTFWPMLRKHDKKVALITILIILACHAALSVGFVLYFYSSASSSTQKVPRVRISVTTSEIAAVTTLHHRQGLSKGKGVTVKSTQPPILKAKTQSGKLLPGTSGSSSQPPGKGVKTNKTNA